MKILVMGSGAVGGYFGAVLHKAGEDVTLVARGAHLEAIRQRGLRVEMAEADDFTVRPSVIERPDGSWKADLVLFCVKGYHNQDAMRVMAPAVGEDTAILTLQNGIGSGDELGETFGSDKVLLGAAYIEASRKGPGVVYQGGGPCRIVFGEPDGRATPRAVAVRDTLDGAGIDVELSSDVDRALWDKLVFICALSGMMCITRSLLPEVLAIPETRKLAERAMTEATQVARAMGVGLADDIVATTMDYLDTYKESLSSSMYLDLQSGNRLELNVLNGAVSRLGKQSGVETPVNDFITACLTVYDERVKASAT